MTNRSFRLIESIVEQAGLSWPGTAESDMLLPQLLSGELPVPPAAKLVEARA